jgi:hypothetical protein
VSKMTTQDRRGVADPITVLAALTGGPLSGYAEAFEYVNSAGYEYFRDVVKFDFTDNAALRRRPTSFKIARVKFFPNRTFRFNDNGILSAVMTPRGDRPETYAVAWPLHRPEKFAPIGIGEPPRHAAEIIFGEDHEAIGRRQPQFKDRTSLPIWRTPLTWLQHQCDGLCIPYGSLRCCLRVPTGCILLAEDEDHASDVRRQLGDDRKVTVVS